MSEGNENQYIESIPEQFRDVESIKNAGSLDNLLEQHVNLEKKMGTAVFAPGEDADEEQMGKFYSRVNDLAPGLTRIPASDDEEGMSALFNKLGRPDEVAGYEVPEVLMGDGKPLNQDAYSDAFKEHAHKIGISKSQFAETLKWFGDRQVAAVEDAQTKAAETLATLKGEWGDSTDARMQRVNAFVQDQGGEEALAAMGELGNNPVVLKMLDKMAESMLEEGSLGRQGAQGDAATKTAIEDDIATLKGNEAFMDRKHADHKRTIERVNALYEKLEQFRKAA